MACVMRRKTNIRDHADFAPRLGFAWNPKFGGKESKAVIRVGSE